jgi:hypothetical protein
MHANAMTFPAAAFDKIVTIGAIEHIADLDGLWRDCRRLLRPAPEARLLAHGMTVPAAVEREPPDRARLSGESSFLAEYVFPVGQFTQLSAVVRPLEEHDFEVLDVENITDHYALTLRRWYDNLVAHTADVEATGVEPERCRAQLLFLAGAAATFAENRVLCYQTLARPIAVDDARAPLAPTRRAFVFPYGAGEQAGAVPEPALPEPASAAVEVEIAGPGGGTWSIDPTRAPHLAAGPHPAPAARVRIAGDDFAALVGGRLRWTDAFVAGRIEVTGDLVAAVRLRRLVAALAEA